MRGRLLIATAVALIGLIFAVGCGDDDESTANPSGSGTATETTDSGNGTETTDGESGSGTETTEADPASTEFIAQANSICAKRVAEIQLKGQRVFKKIFNLPGKVAAKKLADAVIVPAFSQELRELKALDQPPADSQELEAIYREIEEVIEYFAGNPQPSVYPYKKAENLTAKYGIEKCGKPQ